MKRIRKMYSGVVPNGKVLTMDSSSNSDTYSCAYLNDKIKSHDYSTEEIRIGTWLGKPLYRKVLEITVPSQTSYKEIDLGISNIDTIMLNDKSHIIHDSYRIPLNSSTGNSEYSCWAAVTTSGRIVFSGTGTAIQGKTAYIIVEYTKTTD